MHRSEASELRRVRSDPRLVVAIYRGLVRAVPDWTRHVWTLGDRDRLTFFIDTFFRTTEIPKRWRDGTISDGELEAVAECLCAVYGVDAREAANE